MALIFLWHPSKEQLSRDHRRLHYVAVTTLSPKAQDTLQESQGPFMDVLGLLLLMDLMLLVKRSGCSSQGTKQPQIIHSHAQGFHTSRILAVSALSLLKPLSL